MARSKHSSCTKPIKSAICRACKNDYSTLLNLGRRNRIFTPRWRWWMRVVGINFYQVCNFIVGGAKRVKIQQYVILSYLTIALGDSFVPRWPCYRLDRNLLSMYSQGNRRTRDGNFGYITRINHNTTEFSLRDKGLGSRTYCLLIFSGNCIAVNARRNGIPTTNIPFIGHRTCLWNCKMSHWRSIDTSEILNVSHFSCQ